MKFVSIGSLAASMSWPSRRPSACLGEELAPAAAGADAGFPKSTGANAKAIWRTLIHPVATRQGFSLLEALVALTVLLAFAAALGPVLMQARRIIAGADDRVAAQILLRALISDPVDPAHLNGFAREGQSEGLQWRVTAEPTAIAAMLPSSAPRPATADTPPSWAAYRVVARVEWGHGQSVSAETVRLGKAVP